jgi:hypothetical protein
MELLKLYARNISEEDLLEVRKILAQYFMQKAIQSATKTWEERGYDQPNLLNEPT